MVNHACIVFFFLFFPKPQAIATTPSKSKQTKGSSALSYNCTVQCHPLVNELPFEPGSAFLRLLREFFFFLTTFIKALNVPPDLCKAAL